MALAVCLLGATALVMPALAAKTKGGKGRNVSIAQTVGLPVPSAAPPPGPDQADLAGELLSTINVSKKFKGRKIRDVNVTVQTIGGSANPIDNRLAFQLTAPNGATVPLAFIQRAGTSVGPLTFDDETSKRLAVGATPANPFQLGPPYVGTVQPNGSLFVMDNGRVHGTWTLAVLDRLATPAVTSTLGSWTLSVTTGRPYRSR
jgi:hypothetical protein